MKISLTQVMIVILGFYISYIIGWEMAKEKEPSKAKTIITEDKDKIQMENQINTMHLFMMSNSKEYKSLYYQIDKKRVFRK